MKSFYFGCHDNQAGHYLRNEKMECVRWESSGTDRWIHTWIDSLPPTNTSYKLPQGKCYHWQLNTGDSFWSMISFVDNSIDNRGGSHSIFIFEGEHNFNACRILAEQIFPQVTSRFTTFQMRMEI